MAGHLERAHEDKSDLACALSFKKGSKERKRVGLYPKQRKLCSHCHIDPFLSVMQSGKGQLVPFKHPANEGQGKDFMHCG